MEVKERKVSREMLCDRLRKAVGSRTHAEIAAEINSVTKRRVQGPHVSEALNPVPKDPKKYDRLRRDMAIHLLGGTWVIQRSFVRIEK